MRAACVALSLTFALGCGTDPETGVDAHVDGDAGSALPDAIVSADAGNALVARRLDVATLTPTGETYFDPETLASEGLITFLHENAYWVAQIDPATGLFAADAGGLDYLVDDDAAPIGSTFSGPEFGLDRDGWSVVYDKMVADGIQVWRGLPRGDGSFDITALSAVGHQTSRASKDPTSDSTRVACIRGTFSDGVAVWFDEDDPARTQDLGRVEPGVIMLSWIRGETDLVWTLREGEDRGEVAIVDLAAGELARVTDDDDDKRDPYAWHAPELGGDLAIVATVDDDTQLAVYRRAEPMFERVATIPIPETSEGIVLGSAEPFVAGGRSYISFAVKNRDARIGQFEHGEVWVTGIDPDPSTRVLVRCDDGESGIPRFDPESFVTDERVFVYYNAISAGGVQIRRCSLELPR